MPNRKQEPQNPENKWPIDGGIWSVVIITSGKKIARRLDSTAIEIASGADAMPEWRGVKKEITDQKMVVIQLVALNDIAQLAKLCMSIGTKGGLAQKGYNLVDS